MSNFKIKAKHKNSGAIHDIWVIDNYFRGSEYGYVPNVKGHVAMTEKQFYNKYEVEDKNDKNNFTDNLWFGN